MNFKNDVLPHLVAIMVFSAVTTVFYSPLVFSGKTLKQHDIQQGLGASQEIIEYRNQTGEEALWTNSMFGGMPGFLINTRWSGDLMLHIQHALFLWLPSPAGVTFICAISFYILLLSFGVRPWLAIAGGLAFSLGSFYIISIEAGHMWKMFAIAYMPLVLAGVHLTFRKRYLLGFAVMVLGLGLELRSNHLQITYYLLILLLIYGVVHLAYAIKEKQVTALIKPMGYLMIAAVLALLCNIGKIWSVYEYGKYSTRGGTELTKEGTDSSNGLDKDYAFSYSNGILEPLTLLVPEFFGGPSVQALPVNSDLGEALRKNGLSPIQIRQQLERTPTYWGDQPFVAGPSYAGAIVILLFVLALFVIDNQHRIWLAGATLLAIVLSWGNNFEMFNNFVFEYFPGYNKFRSVSMIQVIALLCIPLAGFMGLERILLHHKDPQLKKKLLQAGMVVGSILVLAIIYASIGSFRGGADQQMASQVPSWYLEALKADRASLLRSDALRSLILAGLFWLALYYHLRGKLSMVPLYLTLTVLTLFDLWGINKRYLQKEDFVSGNANLQLATAADQHILQDPDPNFRVISFLQNPWADARTSYFHKSIGGYHGAKLQRYADVIEECLDSEFRGVLQDLQNRNPVGSYPVLNMLNTRYILAGTEQGGALLNNNALGNAWFVSKVIKVTSPDQEINTLCQLKANSEAVVDQSKFPLEQISYNSSGSITLEEYQPNYLRYQSQNTENGFAVFSEIYYPKGWQATIDGTPVDILRANYLLRALQIPAGSHVIEFRFLPKAYYVGNKIMMAASILVIMLVLTIILIEIRKYLKVKAQDHP